MPGQTSGTSLQNIHRTRRHRPDYLLPIIALGLAAIGIVVLFSISPAIAVEQQGTSGSQLVIRQLIAVALGLLLFGIATIVPLEHWRRLCKPLLIIAALATLLALVLPVSAEYPAHRWIRVAGFSFQSVELLKFAGTMWLASFLASRSEKGLIANARSTLGPLFFVMVGVAVVVAALQSDFGSFAVIVAMMGVMAFIAGLPIRRVVTVLAIIAILVVLLISAIPYRRQRLSAFLRPNCATSGYQSCEALIAVGSGGLIGLGLGRSVQAYGYLPEAYDDSIFAIYAEKFGFVGVTLIVGLFTLLFARIKRVADRAPDEFSRLVVMGILVWLSVQTIINMGAMVGILPLKGITLPLISYGGSSVLMIMAALGIVFQVSKYTLLQDVTENGFINGGSGYDYRHQRRRIRGTYNPTPGRSA
jgi:cell division protein FtsW